MRTPARLLLTLASAASLAIGTAPAQAATYDHTDATGDVRGVTIDYLQAEQEIRYTRRELERAADITQLRVRHGRHRLIMRLETVDLKRRTQSQIGPSLYVRTPDRRYLLTYDAVSDGRKTTRESRLLTGRFTRVRCRGLFTDFDFTGDVTLASVPRRCLGNPQNVRIKAVMLQIGDSTDRREFSTDVLVDSALDDGRRRPLSYTDAIASGPRRAM